MEPGDMILALVERGVTQAEIARLCGCAQSTISELATGKAKTCSWQLGKRIESLLTTRRTRNRKAA